MPLSFEHEWRGGTLFLCMIAIMDLGYKGLDEILLGVGAAPFEIQKTAEYTDRYPDELWVTSSEIQGLHKVPFVGE